MAVTSYGTRDALAVKAWQKKLEVEFNKALPLAPLIGTDANSIIQLKEELSKGRGDRVTYGLVYQLSGRGVSEGNVLEGNEESFITGTDALSINELAHAARIKSTETIDQQRVLFDMRKIANDQLRDWYALRMTSTFFTHVCGYTGKTQTLYGRPEKMDALYWGFNIPTPPSANRWFIANGKANEAALTSTDTFNIQYIDHMVERARLANPQIRPVHVDGEDCYVLYLHPAQVTALRTNTSTGQWLDIAKYADMGKGDRNKIYRGSLGRYNNVILRMHEFVAPGINADGTENTNVRRAVMLGAQAAAIAFSRNSGPNRFTLREEMFDYGREIGVGAISIFGLKKTIYTYPGNPDPAEDYGVIVLSTWAAPSTGILPPSVQTSLFQQPFQQAFAVPPEQMVATPDQQPFLASGSQMMATPEESVAVPARRGRKPKEEGGE